MKTLSKIFAFFSYLLLVPGWLVGLIFFRKDAHVKFHAKQSLVINLIGVLILAIWFVITWLVVSIPLAGPILAWFLFAIVIAVFIYLVLAWVMGMVRSFNAGAKPLPLIGAWAQRLPF
jgi:uncharacterized membrane protein